MRPGAPADPDGPAPIEAPPAPPVAFWLPAAVLGVLTTILGLVPGLATKVVDRAAQSLDPSVEAVHLALWHGVGPALVLSGITLLSGAALVAGGPLVARAQRVLHAPLDGEAAYLGVMRDLNRVADRTTGVVQSGSLPAYIGIILTTAVVVPGYALLRAPMPTAPALVSGPGDWAAAALLIAGAVAAALIRQRMAAVLCLGAVGYGMALVFVLQGAPDLALTQVCVDTIGAVVFVLVMRRLPGRFAERPTLTGRTMRLIVSGLVGVFVFAFILVAGDVRVATPVSGAFVERAFSEGGGRNVVNVVLVDIRGFDTMGEITVLAVAAMGVYALARLSRRESRELRSFTPNRRLGGFGRDRARRSAGVEER